MWRPLRRRKLDLLLARWTMCQVCPIGKLAFRHAMFDGSLAPHFLFIGEGPGVSEDALGLPFVGRSGKLLRQTLLEVGFLPSKMAFANLTACRPTDKAQGENRPPNPYEVDSCSDWLKQLMRIITPRKLVAVGRVPMRFLPDRFSNFHIRSITHPSFILRNGGYGSEEWKRWKTTLQQLKEEQW